MTLFVAGIGRVRRIRLKDISKEGAVFYVDPSPYPDMWVLEKIGAEFIHVYNQDAEGEKTIEKWAPCKWVYVRY